jgi:hypothetical protein
LIIMLAAHGAVLGRSIRHARNAILATCALAVLAGGTSQACVGTECMEIWSTHPGGGALTIYWDFAHQKIQTAKSFCASGKCLYSTIDNGFITTTPPPADGYYSLVDGTSVSFEVVAIDPVVSVHINGVALAMPGDTELLGTSPTLHVHPSWQITVPDGTPPADYPLSFKLTTSSVLYTDDTVFDVVVTNLPTPTPNEPTPSSTPTVTATPTPACPGDCNGDGTVTVAELVSCVAAALGEGIVCAAVDTNHDDTVEISELIAGVNAALNGCPAAPTPTATLPPTLDAIQTTIFSPRCAIPSCHDAATHVENLNLSAGSAYGQLVGVAPATDVARLKGLLRVDAGHPDNSFLLLKLEGSPALSSDEGLRMPETGSPLSTAEIQLITAWIAQGAQP